MADFDWAQLGEIAGAPDNIPIVALLFLIPFFTWYGFRQSLATDRLIGRLEEDPELAKTHHRKIEPYREGWDQKLYVWPHLLGGSIVDANALLRSYIWHCIALPLLISIFLTVHIWRVRKDGSISGPSPVMLESEIKPPRR